MIMRVMGQAIQPTATPLRKSVLFILFDYFLMGGGIVALYICDVLHTNKR